MERSLYCYARQSFPINEMEFIIIDDYSVDHTKTLVMEWAMDHGATFQLLTVGPKNTGWRDAGAILNFGIRAARGEHIIMTHPEVIPGQQSIARLVEKLDDFESTRNQPGKSDSPGLYASCKVYYLSQVEQRMLDDTDWQEIGPLAVREIPNFYENDANGHPDYTHTTTDAVGTPGFRIQTWDSWVFGGCSRETWRRLGGMYVTQNWGTVDVAFNNRRKRLNMEEWTPGEDDTIVVHQNHDDESTQHRIMELCEEELQSIDMANLCYPVVNELEW
jgi:hypothetical protein